MQQNKNMLKNVAFHPFSIKNLVAIEKELPAIALATKCSLELVPLDEPRDFGLVKIADFMGDQVKQARRAIDKIDLDESEQNREGELITHFYYVSWEDRCHLLQSTLLNYSSCTATPIEDLTVEEPPIVLFGSCKAVRETIEVLDQSVAEHHETLKRIVAQTVGRFKTVFPRSPTYTKNRHIEMWPMARRSNSHFHSSPTYEPDDESTETPPAETDSLATDQTRKPISEPTVDEYWTHEEREHYSPVSPTYEPDVEPKYVPPTEADVSERHQPRRRRYDSRSSGRLDELDGLTKKRPRLGEAHGSHTRWEGGDTMATEPGQTSGVLDLSEQIYHPISTVYSKTVQTIFQAISQNFGVHLRLEEPASNTHMRYQYIKMNGSVKRVQAALERINEFIFDMDTVRIQYGSDSNVCRFLQVPTHLKNKLFSENKTQLDKLLKKFDASIEMIENGDDPNPPISLRFPRVHKQLLSEKLNKFAAALKYIVSETFYVPNSTVQKLNGGFFHACSLITKAHITVDEASCLPMRKVCVSGEREAVSEAMKLLDKDILDGVRFDVKIPKGKIWVASKELLEKIGWNAGATCSLEKQRGDGIAWICCKGRLRAAHYAKYLVEIDLGIVPQDSVFRPTVPIPTFNFQI